MSCHATFITLYAGDAVFPLPALIFRDHDGQFKRGKVETADVIFKAIKISPDMARHAGPCDTSYGWKANRNPNGTPPSRHTDQDPGGGTRPNNDFFQKKT
eukprot:PhM_4_TR8435/c1_g1_i1/m.4096